MHTGYPGQIMKNYGLILVTAGLLMAHNAMALDGTIYPVVTFECNTAENTLKIEADVKIVTVPKFQFY